jgi:hypothetical protein
LLCFFETQLRHRSHACANILLAQTLKSSENVMFWKIHVYACVRALVHQPLLPIHNGLCYSSIISSFTQFFFSLHLGTSTACATYW